MNILYIYSSNINPTRGGVQRVTKVLCDAFRKEGHKCYYLSAQPSNEDIEYQHILPGSAILSTENVDFMRHFLQEKSIDVVVNQDGLNKIMTQLVHKSCYGKAKIFTVAHNSLLAPCASFTIVRYSLFKKLHLAWMLPLFKIQVVKKIMNAIYRKKYLQHYRDIMTYSNKLVLLSNAYKNELEFFVPEYPKDKVCTIFNPCTVEHDNSEVFEKRKVCLYVGRISFSQKRNDILLQIWKEIEPKHPDWVLKIVGEGEDLPALKQMAKDLKLNNVFFEGFQSPEPYYREASIFCLTSAYEGFPLVLAEAMSYGVVPIAFNSFGAVCDCISNEQDGLLIEPFRLDEYIDKLDSLICDTIIWNKYSRNSIYKSTVFYIDSILNKWKKDFAD